MPLDSKVRLIFYSPIHIYNRRLNFWGLKMNQLLFKWEVSGILIIFFWGAIIHEAYKLTGYNKIIALFAPVNESVWEHLKMGSTAVLIFSLIEYFFISDTANNFLLGKTFCLYLVPIFIALLHYSYKLILGKHLLILDLLIFLIATTIGQAVSFYILNKSQHYLTLNRFALLALMLEIAIFIYFTFNPPKMPIFRDGPTGRYGPVL